MDYAWQISPDGSWIGIAKRHGGTIRLIPLGKDRARTININGYSSLTDLSWAVDSRSFFVSSARPGPPHCCMLTSTATPNPFGCSRKRIRFGDSPRLMRVISPLAVSPGKRAFG
jgi:hypothetical protein